MIKIINNNYYFRIIFYEKLILNFNKKTKIKYYNF